MISVSSRIRVCSVDEEGRFGGPERRITQIAKAAKIHGIDTHVVYPTYDSEKFARELSQAGVSNSALDITRLSAEKKVLARYTFCFSAEVIRLYRFFCREKFDLVQVNGSQQFKGALAARMAGIPVVWVLEDALMADAVRMICKVAAKCVAAGIIVVGKRVYDYYIRGTALESKPTIEIHPPVDTSIFDPSNVAPDKTASHAQGRKIVTVSGINPTKGLEYFIEMAGHLVARHDDLCFLVAAAEYSSQKKFYQSLKKRVAAANLTPKNFRFLGMVNDVPSFLQSADVFVCTSKSESGPMAVWEAMSMGKPIVTTDVGSVSEYIEDGKSGFIVPIKDSQALSDKVEVLLNDPALRQEMGSTAQAIVRKKLDVSVAAKKYASFYRKILEVC